MKRNKLQNTRKMKQLSGTTKRKSNYRLKSKYLHKYGLWGFEVPEPKPWKF